MILWRLVVWFTLAGTVEHECVQRDVVSLSVEETVIYAGKTSRLKVFVDVQDGYHIQANRVDDESLIPTTLEVGSFEGITIDDQKFPPQKKFRLEGTNTLLDVYDGRFPITLFIKAMPGAPPGSHMLSARLRYQACNSQTCLFPRAIEFSIPVKIRQ